MKMYYDKLNDSFFSCTNFDYEPRENQDYELSQEEYDEYINKVMGGYTIIPTYNENKVVFDYFLDTNNQVFLESLRDKRKPLLEAFDKWEKGVLRGREEDSEDIMNWYQDLLDLKESTFENIPERIQYYL